MQWQALRDWFDPPPREGSSRFRSPSRIFWVGLFVRIAYMTLAHTYKVTRYEDHFEFGWEAARIARALATGHGYADPFIQGGTGPTAWLPPVFPMMIAACFKLFGVYTPIAAWAVLALDCLLSAATALAVYEIGARCFNHRVAIWSGWLWALYPAAMQYAVKWVWETTLTTMLFAWVLVLALRVGEIGTKSNVAAGVASNEPTGQGQTLRRWLLFGLLWGIIALCNPSLLLFLPVCGVWMLWRAPNLPSAFLQAVAAGVLFCACLAPWVWRNRQVFHAFIPIRGNFGAELYFGNNPFVLGFPWGHIVESQRDMQNYARMGEFQYVTHLGATAKQYIATHPQRFLVLTLKRIYFFWVSIPHPTDRHVFAEYFREFHYCFLSITGLLGLLLALKRRIPASGLFACAFLLLPFTYYFVTVAARFRHPLEVLIVMLTVYLFQSAKPLDSKHAQAARLN